MTVIEDPIAATRHLFPLGRPGEIVEASDASPSAEALRPFGLRFAAAVRPIEIDLSDVRFDPQTQINADEAGRSVVGKHTDGQTKTKTSDGHKSMDSDQDHRED